MNYVLICKDCDHSIRLKLQVFKIARKDSIKCTKCGSTATWWQDIEKTYIEVERVYATRIDCCTKAA